MINRKLANKIAKRIEDYPESYDQSVFFFVPGELIDEFDLAKFKRAPVCGTSACVAGHAVALNGGLDVLSVGHIDADMWSVPWVQEGAKALGLTPNQADWLFDSCRDGDDMPEVLRALGRGKRFSSVVQEFDPQELDYADSMTQFREYYDG